MLLLTVRDCRLHVRAVANSGNQTDTLGLDIHITMLCDAPISGDNLVFPLPNVLVPLANSRILDFGQDYVVHIPWDLYMSILLSITHVLRIRFNSELSLHSPASC